MWLSPLSGWENWVQEMVPRQRWLGRDVWARGSTRTGRAVNPSVPWLSSPVVRAPMGGKVLCLCVPGGCWSYVIPTWCPGYPAFDKVFPRKQDQTFFPLICVSCPLNLSRSHQHIQFSPVFPDLLTILCASLELLPCFSFSLSPFLGSLKVWRGVKCHR